MENISKNKNLIGQKTGPRIIGAMLYNIITSFDAHWINYIKIKY